MIGSIYVNRISNEVNVDEKNNLILKKESDLLPDKILNNAEDTITITENSNFN